MCPYCGEEVPDDSTRCWKCGTEMSEGGGSRAPGGEDELEVPADDDEPRSKSGSELVNCPFCDSPMPRSAMRCKECGRAVRAPEAARGALAWKLGPWLIFLAVAVGAALVVGLVAVKKGGSKPAVREPIAISFKDLDSRIGPLRKVTNEGRRLEIWNEHFKNKYVKWDGYLLKREKLEGGTLVELELAAEKDKKKADVVVSFPVASDDPDEAHTRTLKVGDKVAYTARLVEFGGRCAFTLEDGSVE